MCAVINTTVSSLDTTVKKLEKSGFYWGAISALKAKALLRDQPVGKFLVRDSSDSRHLFAITLVTATGITNVRIVLFEGLYTLDKKDTYTTERNSEEFQHRSTPRFDCVVKMVFYYMLVTRKLLQGDPSETLEDSGTAKFLLWSPLYKEVSSLQHLCRKTLNNQLLAKGIKDLPAVPNTVKLYLSQYPYPI